VYLRVTRAAFDPANADAVAALGREVRAAAARQPGFDRALSGYDRAAGRLVVVSVWDTAEHAGFDRTQQLGDLVARGQALGLRLEAPEVYELSEG
jgi:hypothetical protein